VISGAAGYRKNVAGYQKNVAGYQKNVAVFWKNPPPHFSLFTYHFSLFTFHFYWVRRVLAISLLRACAKENGQTVVRSSHNLRITNQFRS